MTLTKEGYEHPSYFDNGMEVLVRYPTASDPTSALKCIVTCAMGNHARVVSRNPAKYPCERLVSRYDVLVKCGTAR